MKIDVLTLFPEMVQGPMTQSIIGKAIEAGKIEFETTDFRQFSNNKHNHVDDYPFGGGAGMLLKVEPIDLALASIRERSPETTPRVILMDPAGKTFTQKDAEELSKEEHLVFICGHYEGYDERIRTLVTDEYSIGDFVLTGGELAATVMIDATVRLLPDVLGMMRLPLGIRIRQDYWNTHNIHVQENIKEWKFQKFFLAESREDCRVANERVAS